MTLEAELADWSEEPRWGQWTYKDFSAWFTSPFDIVKVIWTR